MRSRLATTTTFSPVKKEFSPAPAPASAEKAAEEIWEVRPCGMLVQKREDSDRPAAPVPAIRVKVKHNAVYHEIYISSQATFGELKKELSSRTGLHPQDQKLIYKDKERDSAAFLDTAGVKDRSKLVLVEDPVARAKRLLEERKVEKMEKAARSISAISLQVDKLASKVSALEGIVNKGGRVVEDDVVVLIEQLMNELIKLDGIVADGDVKLQRRMQVKRVQKYVETLDAIKAKNAMAKANGHINKQQQPQQHKNQLQQPKQQQPKQPQPQFQQQNQHYYHQQAPPQPHTQFQLQEKQQKKQPEELTPPATPTANWEFFDSLFTPSTSTPTSAATTTSAASASSTPTTRFDWELF